MMKMRALFAAMAAFGTAAATSDGIEAQQSAPTTPPSPEATSPVATLDGASITLRVDGMVCPFCAYGLEKRLGEIESIDAILIRISDGLVQIRVKEGRPLEDEALEEAVERAGFSLREIHRVTS